jgi:hypothetical protein
MKLRWITLLLAILMAGAMAIAIQIYGAHSTPGIRLSILNAPGVFIGLWASLIIGENLFAYVLIPLANWAFYFYATKGIIVLYRKLSK